MRPAVLVDITEDTGVPFTVPKILCESCSVFNTSKKVASDASNDIDKLNRKMIVLQSKHTEVYMSTGNTIKSNSVY